MYLYTLRLQFPNCLPFHESIAFKRKDMTEEEVLEEIKKWDTNPRRTCRLYYGGDYTGTIIKIINIEECSINGMWEA